MITRAMDNVIEIVRSRFLYLFDEYIAHKNELIQNLKYSEDSIIKEHKKNLNQNKVTTSNCPHCKVAPMKVIKTKKGRFLACQNKECSNKYLNLPNKGKLYIMASGVCGKCGFNIFKFYTRKNNKNFSYYMCPNCWNIGYKEKNSKKGFCSNCENYKVEKGKCKKVS
ncbi:MAG: hypothetical protein P8Y70_19100 [Candidatus Lokiarchaeota archaeon]